MEALIKLFLFQGGGGGGGGGRLLEGALKRGWALNSGFTVYISYIYIYNIYIYIYLKIYIYVFFYYKKHLYKKHEAEMTDAVD